MMAAAAEGKMEKIVKLLIMAAGTALLATSAQAQTRGGFEVGAEVFSYGYEEFDQGNKVVRDEGTFGGLHFGYVETIGNGLFLRALVNGAVGSVDYESDEGTKIDNVEQSSGRVELNVGKDFNAGGTIITAFTGFGGRLLEDKSGGLVASDGSVGYDREVDYDYVPFGLAAGVPLGRMQLALSAQYNIIVRGSSVARFSRIDPEFEDIEVRFRGGHGLEASALLGIPLDRHQLNFGPFVRHWSLKKSDSFIIVNPDDPTEAIELTEPKNRTTELGVRLSFAF
jgi:hypothetical protein